MLQHKVLLHFYASKFEGQDMWFAALQAHSWRPDLDPMARRFAEMLRASGQLSRPRLQRS
jgi:hypothetical protein